MRLRCAANYHVIPCKPSADHFVAKQLITPWQRRMLLEGHYKGFFVDREFKLLEHLGCVNDNSR